MINGQFAILACWGFLLFYWFISSRTLKPVEEVKNDLGGFWGKSFGRILVLFLFLESFKTFPVYPFTISLMPQTGFIQILSVISVIAGLMVAVFARKTLADNWSREIDIKKGHKLIKSGLYKYVRHPIYTGVLLMFSGTFLYALSLSAAILLLSMTAFFWFKSRQEEVLLIQYFPDEYPKYKKQVKSFVPFVF